MDALPTGQESIRLTVTPDSMGSVSSRDSNHRTSSQKKNGVKNQGNANGDVSYNEENDVGDISKIRNRNESASDSEVEDRNANETYESPLSRSEAMPILGFSEERQKRRMVACKACHALKVRCVPVNSNEQYGPCVRCVKREAQCEFDLTNTRKRKPVTLSAGMKLKKKEEEIEVLKRELKEKDNFIKKLRGIYVEDKKRMGIPIPKKELLEKYAREMEELKVIINDSSSDSSSSFMMNSERRVQLSEEKLDYKTFDIIDRKYLTVVQCRRLLDLFLTKVYPRYPLIELPKNLSVESLRKDDPLLLMILVYIATNVDKDPSDISVQAQLQLESLISRSLSQEVLVIGNKNFNLLKSLLMYCIWYIPPELFHHRRYHMYTILCVCMSHDLGLTGKPYFFYSREEGAVKKAAMLEDKQNLQLKSLVLVVYFTTLSISLFLRRRISLQWSDYLNQCCLTLEQTNQKNYQIIALYARLNHMLERIYSNIHMSSEQMSVMELSSSRNQMLLMEYQDQLSSMKQRIGALLDDNKSDYHCLMAYVYSVEAYLYEPGIQILIKSKNSSAPEYQDVFYNTLSQICESCKLSLKHFSELNIDVITVNPLFHTSRILYTSGMLLRIRYLSLTLPNSGMAGLFTEEAIETVQALTDKIHETAIKYPKNHFMKKIRLVLGLFAHTCLNQWSLSYKNLKEEIQRENPSFVGPKTKAITPDLQPDVSPKNSDAVHKHIITLPPMPFPFPPPHSSMAGYTRPHLDPNLQPESQTPILEATASSASVNPRGNRNITINNSLINPSASSDTNINSMNYRSILPYMQSSPGLQVSADQTTQLPPVNNLPYLVSAEAHASGTIDLWKSQSSRLSSINSNSSYLRNTLPSVSNPVNVSNINAGLGVGMNLAENPNMDEPTTNLTVNGIETGNRASHNLEFQYMAFNDEFWSDLFFGNNGNLSEYDVNALYNNEPLNNVP